MKTETPSTEPDVNDQFKNPPSIMPFSDAERAVTDPADMVHLPARLRKLKEIGECAELIGFSYMYKGDLLVSILGCSEIEKNLVQAIKSADDTERLVALANAFAAVIKAKAFAISKCSDSSADAKQRKGRRSFAKGAPIGPMIDVKKP